MHASRLLRALALVAVWLVVAVVTGVSVFLNQERNVVVASHEAVLKPTFSGEVVVHTGPVLPDVRMDSGRWLGVDVQLGKTNAESIGELVQRYAVMAGQPEGSIAKVRLAVTDMALDATIRGAVTGLIPVAVWLLVGRERRRQLWAMFGRRHAVAAGIVLGVVVSGVLVWEPWSESEAPRAEEQEWLPLPAYLGPSVPVPDQLADVEVRADTGAIDARRLIESAVSTYRNSKEFYDQAAEDVAHLRLRQPNEDQTVAVLVSDRHDNIGMDRVARAIGDRAGATVVLDAGDDTSTGERWEAFSLDSVTAAFDGYARFGVSGNHDHGDFVQDYLSRQGWTMLDGQIVEGPGGGSLIGVGDPRSSGLGNWRDETGLSFGELAERLADEACEAEDRVETVLVHDANLARDVLQRGCADLVLGGHVHVTISPRRVDGENGEVGYTYTTGTTGGAAYAIAIGSKPRRDAVVSLVTYGDDGRPVGIQAVTLQTNGTFVVGPFEELTY